MLVDDVVTSVVTRAPRRRFTGDKLVGVRIFPAQLAYYLQIFYLKIKLISNNFYFFTLVMSA